MKKNDRMPMKTVARLVRVAPIRTDADLTRAHRRIAKLWGAKAGARAADELDVLGDLVFVYELTHHPVPVSGGMGTLRALMDGNDLTASDFPEIGSPRIVRQILSGKRDLTVREIKRLALRFGVPPGAFIEI